MKQHIRVFNLRAELKEDAFMMMADTNAAGNVSVEKTFSFFKTYK